MKAGIGESRRRQIVIAIGISAVLCLLVAAPALAGKPPAVDEYTLNFPHPGGGGDSGNGGDGSNGSSDGSTGLSPGVRDQLTEPGDASLIAIATDPALGAIDSAKTKSGESSGGGSSTSHAGATSGGGGGLDERPGVLTAATSALTGGSVPWLGLGLLASLIGAFVARRRSSTG